MFFFCYGSRLLSGLDNQSISNERVVKVVYRLKQLLHMKNWLF